MSGDEKEEKADVKQVLAGVIQDIEVMEEENKDLRADLGLDKVPETVLQDEEGLQQVQYIMEKTGLLTLIEED